MKRIINMLLYMIYPALISLFTLCFVKAFVVGKEWTEPLIGITAFLTVAFMIAFIAGFVWNIVYSIKHKDE